jgi:predicted TPR repeat methyltransferase
VDYAVDFSTCASPTDRVAVIATAPLTSNEEWFEFKRGQLLMFNNGTGYSELHDCNEIEQQGRGLVSNTMPKQDECCKGYGTPALLRSLVDQVMKEQQSCDAVLPYAKEGADLGCGSGCSGLSFRNCVTRLTGMDISLEMVDRAKLRGCYDCLLAGDIETVLQEASVKFDIIFASNVLAFIEDIRGVFAAVRKSLAPNGIFAFSAETIDLEDGEQGEKKENQGHAGGDQLRLVLQSCARYAHESIYIRELASEHGFSIARIQESNLREHNGRIVKGVEYVLVTMSS